MIQRTRSAPPSDLPAHALVGTWLPITLVVVALVPLGSARSPLMTALLTVAAGAAFLWALVRLAQRQGMTCAAQRVLDGTDTTPFLGIPIVVLIQALLWPRLGLTDGSAHAIRESAYLLGALWIFYLLARSAAADRGKVRSLITALVMVSALEALYGLLNLLAGNEYLLGYRRWIHFDSATGTFYSRNQFAYLLEMTLPVAVSAAAIFSTRARSEDERRARKLLAILPPILMALAFVFSRSRMGIVSLASATVVVLLLNRALRPQADSPPAHKRRHVGMFLAAAVVLGFAAVIGVEPVLERFLMIPQDLENGRWPLWQVALEMARERPLLGHGWGTFAGLAPAYRARPTGVYYDHAHNDYLEVLAETGIVGLALLLWLVVLFARRLAASLGKPLTDAQRRVIVALGIAIVSVLFHSAADFGLRIPGLAFTFALVAALFSRVTEDPSLIERRRKVRSEQE
jgi:O-antigen ligase